MAYHFKATETVPEGIRRIVREQVESATSELLNGNGPKRDEAIHEARKSIKKLRGALRLMQPELGHIYREQNAALRDAGRQLSEIRDAKAIVQAFDGVVERYRDQLRPEAADAVRSGLLRNKQETEERIRIDEVAEKAIRALRGAAEGVDAWPLERDGFEALAAGFKKRYARGREAMEVARKKPTAANHHEWRKRVKDHWYHVRLLENLWTDVLKAREIALKELETGLGDDHNLIVLREKLESDPDLYGGTRNVEVFTSVMEEYSRELRGKMLVLGAKVYEQKPKLLTLQMAKLWSTWRGEPAIRKSAARQGGGKRAGKDAAA